MELPGDPFLGYIDPNWAGWAANPIPPVPPPGKRRLQVVWPRDKKQKGAHTLGRFWDVLSGKGPDMWVGQRGPGGPTRPEWSRWDIGDIEGEYNNLGYRDNRYRVAPPWGPGRADEGKLYNFDTRRYEAPHANIWSDVKWDRKGKNPRYVRNLYGQPTMHPELVQHVNPFQHDPRTNWWDWYYDDIPGGFPFDELPEWWM
ncbi:MAG: hypothetical protein Q9207_008096 [Kuettlingeria erythrocarpa]